MSDDDRVDLETLNNHIEESIGDLMDQNARLMRICRAKANKLFALAESLDGMADEYRRIASLHVLAAKEHAHLLADTIDAEYNIEEEDDELDEEEGESKDGDLEDN